MGTSSAVFREDTIVVPTSCLFAHDLPIRPNWGEEEMMSPNPANTPRGLITELRAALDAIPADDPRNYLRQSLQLLLPLLEQMHQRLHALEARLEALESGSRRPGDTPPPAPSAGA
jgi:hypothetical protein